MRYSQDKKKINRLRRKLCLSLVLVPGSVCAKDIIADSENTLTGKFDRNQYRNFFSAWNNAFVQTPYSYITERNEMHAELRSSEIVAFDFINGNVIEIDSFILSKYEAAVIAHIASQA